LPFLVAHLTCRRQKFDRGHPFFWGQLHFLRKGVNVFDKRAHDLLEPWVLAVGHALDHGLRQVFDFKFCHAVSPFLN